MPLYLKNANFIDWRSLRFQTVNIRIEEGPKDAIEFVAQCPRDAFDCSGMIVTKAFACAHHHAYSALALGMPPPRQTPHNFEQKLKFVWWNIDTKLDAEIIRACGLITAMYCAKNGITFIIDHHSSPFATQNSLEILTEAFDQVGIGHLLCYEMTDRNGKEYREHGLKETERFLQRKQGLVGLHASFTVSDDLLKKAVSLAHKYNSGIHIHVAEDQIDQSHCLKYYGCRVIERLYKFGVLGLGKSILAHCIHLNEDERQILSESNAWIAVNTESNLNNMVGLFEASGGMQDKVMLGTDGMHSDMLRSAQWHYLTHKKTEQLSVAKSYDRLRRVHDYIERNVFQGDGENNLVIIDYLPPTPVNQDNWLGHFFSALNSTHINSVISQGKFIVKNRKLMTVNEEEIKLSAKIQAQRLWSKL
jgi:cytosine/adenosine deaminase-related metal-dependent hydrolase